MMYDLSTSTYSRDGRVYQIEYASKAVETCGTTIGIRCVDGVVLVVEKIITSKMLVEGSGRRVSAIDRHMGVATTGIVADARQLVRQACEDCKDYRRQYAHAVPTRVLAERLGGYVHAYTLYSYLRPFAVATLIAGHDDEDQYQLRVVEPSGVTLGYFASAVGKGAAAAKTELEKLKFAEFTCQQAVTEIARIIYSIHDEVKDKEFELEMSWVCEASGKKFVPVPSALLDAAVAAAKAALVGSDVEDMDA